MERIGFIGLGRMGRPMATNLARKGFDVLAYDIAPASVQALTKAGAKAANGVSGLAAASDIVITMLPGSPEVEATVLGADGVLAHGRSGQIIMDMSTIDPASTDRLA